MTLNGQRWAGLGLLAAVFLALGIVMVPAHWGSLWGDRDFTDWSVPIANRLHDGARLYTEGLHSPMPPLPYVLPRILFPQGGVWLDGSALNYGCQTAMILLLFWAFAGEVGAGVALVAALAAIPVYLSFQKTMLYDSMAQLLVAAIGIATTVLVRRKNGATDQTRRWGSLFVLGTLLALLMLTKQNTAVGAVAGVSITLALLPRGASGSQRYGNILATWLITGIVFCGVALALHPFLSFSGLVHDVFLTGSEPKGGPLRLVKSLVIYSVQMGVVAGGLYLLSYICHACVGTGMPALKSLLADGATETKSGVVGKLWIAGLGATALGLGLAIIYARTGVSLKGTMMETAWGTLVLNAGLCLVLLVIGRVVLRSENSPIEHLRIQPLNRSPLGFSLAPTGGEGRGEGASSSEVQSEAEAHPLAPYAVVFLCAALFHNLSVMRLRWTVDNNPLVFAALALVVMACVRRGVSWRTAVVAGFIIFIMWPLADFLTLNVAGCTERWPEVRHLASARLRPESAGMRKLVQTVRFFTDPARKETVLFLPEDPNVEAWFERDRPKLSCAIIFTDQYWDRYVEQDLARLLAAPPKVIVIGPRNYWRFFCRGWHVNGAAERLIDLVREKMIAKDYELKSEQEIAYQGGTDFMDVYVRKD